MRAIGDLIPNNLNRRGITAQLNATEVCRFAERLHPGLYRAISYRNGTVKLEVSAQSLASFRVVEGAIFAALRERFPMVERLKVVRE